MRPPGLRAPSLTSLTVPAVLAAALGPFAVVFGALWALGPAGDGPSSALGLLAGAAFALTALLGLAEALAALRPARLPRARGPAPPATAIIAAYLPNEAAIVLDTVRAFLRLRHSAELTIVLAYNTPERLPVERELRALADAHPRLVVLEVAGSRSKAENVNAALRDAPDGIVGVFDADHEPAADCFERAWCWLSAGYDAVQGRCAVRDGGRSLLARLVAVEFDLMYGVSHPGRTRLHGFGLFGGSNGFWRTETLRRLGLDSGMLTEDIDVSVRLLAGGGRVACDPALVSRELAPPTATALVHQRLRWAQGWLQVSRRRAPSALRGEVLDRRRKLGLLHLFGWCAVAPWLLALPAPVLAYELTVARGPGPEAPVLLGLAGLGLASCLAQAGVAARRASPGARPRPAWVAGYLLVSMLVYAEAKNAVARVAHVREALHRREWRVTARPPASRRAGREGAAAALPVTTPAATDRLVRPRRRSVAVVTRR